MRTLRTCLLFIIILAIFFLAGCEAQKLVKEGDALMLADRPADAVMKYKEALEKDTGISKQQGFTGKLKKAQSLAKYEEGSAYAKSGNWEMAIRRFSESLEFYPELEKAKDALRQAKRQASESRYNGALKYADQGKLDRAINELKRALELDPDNLDVKDALSSVKSEEYEKHSQVKQLYDESLVLQEGKQWSKSAELLRRARNTDPSHLMCRIKLHKAEENMQAARKKNSTGNELLQVKRLDAAIRAFEESLGIWPYYEEAKRQLLVSQKQREESESLYEEAEKLSEEGKWDEVVQIATATLEVFPFHEKALSLLTLSKQRAAEAHNKEGKALLAEGKLEEGEKKFLRSLNYFPDMIEAREGLAKADYIRGEEYEKKDLWGNALLWYMDAKDHVPKRENLDKIRKVRSKIFDRVCFALRQEVKKSQLVAPSASAALRSRIASYISNQKPDFLSLVSGPREVKQPLYNVLVEPTSLKIKGGSVRSENRIHRYTEYREVSNPEIPRLQAMLNNARNDLVRLRQEFNRTCVTCGGRGTIECSVCRGSGQVMCTICRGRGWNRYGDEPEECNHCRGTGKVGCRECGAAWHWEVGKGIITCSRCRGSGRESSVTELDISIKQSEIQNLANRLQYEPHTIQQGFPAEWPYVVNYHEKTGLIEAGLSVKNLATETVAYSDIVRKSERYQDSMIQNANPSIGLSSDGLDLPSDEIVQRTLVDAAASEVVSKLLNIILNDRISYMRSKAEGFKQQGKPHEAVEALVDTARLIEPSNPSEAARIIKVLRVQRNKS